jgi:hypothetical protein
MDPIPNSLWTSSLETAELTEHLMQCEVLKGRVNSYLDSFRESLTERNSTDSEWGRKVSLHCSLFQFSSINIDNDSSFSFSSSLQRFSKREKKCALRGSWEQIKILKLVKTSIVQGNVNSELWHGVYVSLMA